MAFDFDAAVQAPFRMQPGLRRLAPGATHLSASGNRRRGVSRHLREKLAVLGSYADQALLSAPGFDASAALDTLQALACREHPSALVAEDSVLRATLLGFGVDLDSGDVVCLDEAPGWPEVGRVLTRLDPSWRRAALLTLALEEDFAVLDAATTAIPWLAVCLPSHWAPEEKVGRAFAEVHAPVADNALLIKAADHLTRLVTGGETWERFVWTITAHPRLHAHPDRIDPTGWDAGLDAATLAAQAWFRSERQTFVPVRGPTGNRPQALFTIQVQVQPLRDVAMGERAVTLREALVSMSPAVLAYRGLSDARERLLEWLAVSA